jgi:hypothetical protein
MCSLPKEISKPKRSFESRRGPPFKRIRIPVPDLRSNLQAEECLVGPHVGGASREIVFLRILSKAFRKMEKSSSSHFRTSQQRGRF